jgi:hypothetical protein
MIKTVLATLTALAFTGCVIGDSGTSDTGAYELTALQQSDLNRARQATDAFHSVAAIEAAGYANSGLPCFEGQGFHWLNPSLLGSLDVTTPAAVMYTPDDKGVLKLIALEWITPISDPSQTPPTLFGQTFHGPEHVDGVPFDFYGLHVWAWLNNGSGLFSDTNPKIHCQ